MLPKYAAMLHVSRFGSAIITYRETTQLAENAEKLDAKNIQKASTTKNKCGEGMYTHVSSQACREEGLVTKLL
jgi:hypothetical protein